MGLDFAAAERRGDLEILWHPVGEHILDELAHRLLDAVRRRGVKRLVVDGLSGFQQAALEPERLVRFWSALSNELRALGVTTLHTLEMPELMGTDLRVPVSGISSLAEVMVVLRYVELQSRLYRLDLPVQGARGRVRPHDPRVRDHRHRHRHRQALRGGRDRPERDGPTTVLKSAAVAPSKDSARVLPDEDPGQSG